MSEKQLQGQAKKTLSKSTRAGLSRCKTLNISLFMLQGSKKSFTLSFIFIISYELHVPKVINLVLQLPCLNNIQVPLLQVHGWCDAGPRMV